MADENAVVPQDVNAMIEACNKRFDDAVQALVDQRKAVNVNMLKWRWDTGALAKQIMMDKEKALHERTYGKHVIEDIAELLDETPAAIYNCLAFASMYSAKELAHLQAKEWPWRGITGLITVKDPAKRESMQKAWEDHSLKNTEALKQAIIKYNAKALAKGTKSETRGRKVLTFKSVISAENLLRKTVGEGLPELIQCLKTINISDLEPDKLGSMKEHVAAIAELLPVAKSLIADAEKAIKAFNK